MLLEKWGMLEICLIEIMDRWYFMKVIERAQEDIEQEYQRNILIAKKKQSTMIKNYRENGH